MTDGDKTKADLLSENAALKQRLAQLEQATQDATAHGPHLELLRRASQTLLSTLDADQVLAIVLEEVRHVLGAVASSIWLIDGETGGMVCRHATGPQSDKVVGWRLAQGQGIAGQVAQSGRSQLVADARTDKYHFAGVDHKTGLQSRSIATVPMRVLDRVIGVIQVLDSEPDRFTDSDVQLVESLAATASIAVQIANLYEQTDRLRAYNQSIVQSMKEGVLIGDPAGRITFANPEAARVLGYSAEDIVGMYWRDIVAPRQPKGAQYDSVYGDTGRYEHAMITRSGDHVPVIIGIRGLRYEPAEGDDPEDHRHKQNGAPGAGVVIVFTDISHRVQAERALRQSERRYRQLAQENADLLAQARRDAQTKDLLLNEVNHRVKNNLTAIIGLLYAQQRRPEFASDAAFTTVMKDLVGRIQGLATVHSMLSATGWEPLPLAELASRIVSAAAAGLPADKRLDISVAPSTVLVGPDQAHNLAIVLNELATNTVKHGLAHRQHVRVEIEIEADEHTIRLRYHDDGPIQDEGIANRENHGVGLYLVHNIVQHALGGSVTMKQAEGLEVMLTFKREVMETTHTDTD
jgi:two-component system, sensor histidine kinase PdtaS